MGNATRGLRLEGTNYVFLNEGAYGTIFVDEAAGRVRKILRCTAESEHHCRAVMQREIEALRIAEVHEALAPFVAAPFRDLPPLKVVDVNGSDVTSEFYADAGFEAAYVPGLFCKIGCVNPPNWPHLAAAFRAAGISHLADISVTLDADNCVATVVDFATREIVPEWR